MTTEDYVSFETAKLLKEKGFDEELETVYSEYGELHRIFDKDFYESTNSFNSIANSQYNDITKYKYDFFVTAPTIQMTMKWLREVHKLHIMVDCIGSKNYMPTIQFICNSKDIKVESDENKIGGSGFDSFEEACEAGIKYCLENLILV